MSDQQRPDSLGCYGNNQAITPNIDSLAEGGIRFESAYTPCPLCAPARYSLLTGRYPHIHGVITNASGLRQREQSIAHHLNRGGYRTAAIGKMHLTPWYDNFGFDGRIIAESKFMQNCPDDYGMFLKANGFSREGTFDRMDPVYKANCTAMTSPLAQEMYIDSFIGMSICEYLKNADQGQPFFLMGSFTSPHHPYDPPEPYDTIFDDYNLSSVNFYEGEIEVKPRESYDRFNSKKIWSIKTDQLNGEQIQKIRSNYYGLNTLVDDWIGRIIAVLKEQDLYENTVIIYTSDHGDLLEDLRDLYASWNFSEPGINR